MRTRPAYIKDRIAYRQAKARARQAHDQLCTCPYCLTAARAAELLAERIRLQRLLDGGIDF